MVNRWHECHGVRDAVGDAVAPQDGARAGGQPGAESSILKIVGTELNQRRWELALRMAVSELNDVKNLVTVPAENGLCFRIANSEEKECDKVASLVSYWGCHQPKGGQPIVVDTAW